MILYVKYSTFPHEKYIKNIEILVYFKNVLTYLT